MKLRHAIGMGGVILAMTLEAASAASISKAYDYDAHFTSGPYVDIKGSFHVTSDVVTTIASDFTSDLPRYYGPYSIQTIGDLNIVRGENSPNDFQFIFSGGVFSDIVNEGVFYAYISGGTRTIYNAQSVTFSLPAVPIPASAPMFALAVMALGTVGIGMRFNKSKSAVC